MHNSDTTIGENVMYFMYKYKIVYDDWFNDLSNIFNRIDNQIKNTTQLDDICLAILSYVCELVCVFVCTIVGASPTPACYVGQVSVCIQLLRRGSVSPNTEEHGAM